MAYRPKGFPGVGTLFVAKNVFYATDDNVTAGNASTSSTLVDGSIGIYVVSGNSSTDGPINDGQLVAAAATAANLEGVFEFYFAMGTPSGPIVSPIFDRRHFAWRYRDAEASVAQVTTVSPTVSASPASDDLYQITIVDTTEAIEDLMRISFSFLGSELTTATDTGVSTEYAAIITAYIASSKADTNFPITSAVVSGATLVLTGKTGCSFRVALDGINAGDGIDYTTDYNPGSGQVAQVQQIESDLWAASGGYVNRVLDYGRAPVSMVNTAISGTSAYDLLTLKWLNSRISTAAPHSTEAIPHDAVIAIEAGNTGAGELETVLKALLLVFDYSV